jgi:hypothetical protein
MPQRRTAAQLIRFRPEELGGMAHVYSLSCATSSHSIRRV